MRCRPLHPIQPRGRRPSADCAHGFGGTDPQLSACATTVLWRDPPSGILFGGQEMEQERTEHEKILAGELYEASNHGLVEA